MRPFDVEDRGAEVVEAAFEIDVDLENSAVTEDAEVV